MTYKPLRILDAHHHFWDLQGSGYYPWLQGEYDTEFFLGDYHSMLHTFLPSQYRQETAGFNVIGTVHVEAERSRDEEVEESLFLKKLHERNLRFPLAVVAHAGFMRPDLEDVLSRHAKIPLVRGIRCKPVTTTAPGQKIHDMTGTLRDPSWAIGLACLEKYGFSWDLRVPWWHLEEAAAVVSEFPSVPVVVNHCGLPLRRSEEALTGWRLGMEALGNLPNTMVKISELGLPGNRWDQTSNERVVADTVSIFGYERSMFASNLPVGLLTAPSFGDIVHTVVSALPEASEDDIDKLFCRTAAEFYRISLSELE